MDASNWINLGILTVTALVGILAWLGARHAALEARKQQQEANAAATRSASAAEEATRLQAKALELEESRQQDAAISATKANVTAELIADGGKTSLLLSNRGGAMATNLSIEVKPETNIASIQLTKNCNHFAVSTPPQDLKLASGSTFGYQAIINRGFHPPFDVAIEWDDDSGQRGRWEGTLN
jgi:hypothetical protein